MEFEPGSIVTLKSGGPPLTVVEADGDDVRCVWFAHADDRLQEARIPAACLEAVTEMEGGEDDEDEDDEAPRRSSGKLSGPSRG
jgi:uncharacterized protein YodC (DUF2158 family)